MKPIIKSTKWYGRFWPPERRKVKLLQALADYMQPELDKKVAKAWTDYIVYGIEPTLKEYEDA